VAVLEAGEDRVEFGALRRGQSAGDVVDLVGVLRDAVVLGFVLGIVVLDVDGFDRSVEVREVWR
jgi:hypothetical protein